MDLIGIEPMTSSMPWKRAPSCATGPLKGRTSSIVADALQQVKHSCRFIESPWHWVAGRNEEVLQSVWEQYFLPRCLRTVE